MTRIMNVNGKFTDIYSYVKNILFLTVLLTVGATSVWAQETVQDGGYYYISIKEKVTPNPTPNTNYYICPTENWIWFDNDKQYGYDTEDNGKPFMTTYQCRNATAHPDYDSDKAIWVIEKQKTENAVDYYSIRHAIDGKYLTYNTILNNIKKNKGVNNRLRLHLEESSSPKDNINMLFSFTIPAGKSYYVITPKQAAGYYICITEGNVDELQGSTTSPTGKKKEDGPGPYPGSYEKSIYGTLGIYNDITDVGSPIFLEEVAVYPPTVTINADGSVSMSSAEGTTIYYTTDGSNPKTSGTKITYSSTISASDIASATGDTIKAVAVDNSSNISMLVTIPLATYTYKIVNKSNAIAISSASTKQVVGKSLSGYANIPTEIQSPYISNEENITFYSWEGAFNASNLGTEHRITKTPAQDANIYVTYSTDKLNEKFLHLQMARPMNIKHEESSTYKYIYNNSGTVTYDASAEASITDSKYLWYIGNSTNPDPYNVLVKNSTKTSNLKYASSTLSLDADATPYVITDTTYVDASHQNITLKNISTGDSFTIRVNEVEIPTSYYLIDKAGQIIFGPKESTSATMEIPSEWYSPVVKTYHYWRSSSFEKDGTTYTLKEDQIELSGLAELGTSEHIYITYDVDNELLDLDGRNSLEIEDKVNLTYRLQFAHGVNFNQEDGKDGVMAATRKPIYPYSNGDAALYVYGDERWEEQLASGASTRTRWLWYIEPARKLTNANSVDDLDPYHVKISSYQTQTNYTNPETGKVVTNFHSYLKTYKPEGHNAIVTSVTNDNPAVTGGDEDDPADNSEATEYMILGSSMNNLKLVTVDAISDGSTTERRTVNSFEQYWKNNPTVQKKLTTKVTAVGRNVTMTAAQKEKLPSGWHAYNAWANSQPWVHNNDNPGGTPTTGKKFLKEEHVFQTVDMGDGEFKFIETEIKPMLILLDQHGWEIVRLPLPSGPDDPNRAARYAELHKYSSPMVEKYHFWKTGTKVPGYHKFTVSDPATEKNDPSKEYTADELGRADITNPLTPPNLPDYSSQALVSGKERDWYVTYDVKAEYANTYTAAAEENGTAATPYLIKQNGYYAQYSGSDNTLSSTTTEPDITNVPAGMQWYIKPNFNIDKEMGYHYEGQYEEKSKEDTDQDNFDAGKNGFDPYNVQIKSAVPNTDRYFTANTSGSIVTSLWAGTSSSITLENMTETTRQPGVIGLDQTEMKITNATFMVVDDGHGNMRLMPRFDNTKVMHSFTTLANPATANADSIAKQAFTLTPVPQVVNSSADIKIMGGNYLLDYPFDASSGSIGTKTSPFIGSIEGKIGQSFSVSAPFIAYADGAVIKNVIIENADSISGDTIGAIVATANGATRIYNCGVNSGSVSGSVYAGGIVGLLNDSSRVINCYSYADVGGGTGGGIVGYNSHASNSTDLKTMVMNCMFYGNMTCSSKAPIYNGEIISNVGQAGLGNYNYFLAEQPYVQNNQINVYNCALMAETRFLQRFEFFRMLLNSHLELAAWYATGKYDRNEMMKWVLETADRNIETPQPYPILKAHGQYPSIINYDAENAEQFSEDAEIKKTQRNQGRKFGTLSVTVQMGDGAQFNRPADASITESSLSLPITDKDFEHFNFNYRKVQLPYYNDVGTKNYTGNRVVTGWKIVSITGGTAGSYTTGADATTDADGNITATPYNFADRNCTNKDLYSESGRVFNQGAYWDVPEGVTSITIEPYWAQAVYLADAYPDVVYNENMGTPYNVNVAGRQIYKDNTPYSIAGSSQVVRTTIGNAVSTLFNGIAENTSNNHTVYDYAIVLVGNAHNIGISSGNIKRPYTIMSIDADHDNEPDYSYILRFNSRNESHPVRVDFVNMPGLGMAQKSTGGSGSYNFGILIPKGWFESTNTSLFRVTQFEYEHGSHPATSPIIVQGGVFEQWVSNNQKGTSNKIPYIHVGGNAWFKEFHTGCHQDKSIATKHSPISVTGGDYNEFYLTGLYRGDVTSYADNAECYINGGRFGIVCGAAMEGVGKANGADNTGNITWQIQNADIEEFYAGGLNAARPVTGNLSTTITDSHVGIYCGGPKFGDISPNKIVTTRATNCTFGTYFGAGYGGNSYSRYAPANQNNVTNINWNNWLNTEYKQEYNATYGGVSTQFSYQFLPMSDNVTNVARILIDFVKFSLATTHNVTSQLTGCTVTGNFYGGGRLGKVDGNVTSTLNGCTVKGNIFGAGYSAELPTVTVDALGFETEPYYYTETGTYRTGVKYKEDEAYRPTTYTWAKKTGNSWINKTDHILYTNEDLTTLGAVTGTVTLTIDGASAVGDNANANSGNVYGGGESSDATSDVTVNVLNGSMTDVYGGGKGQTTVVGGDVTVNIGAKDGGGSLSGSGTVKGSVYGGSALGVVNAISIKDGNGNITGYAPSADKTAHVNIYGGAVTGSVFGGGLGEKTGVSDIAAQNFGDAIISMEGGSIGDAIYGGANANGVLKADAKVTLLGGTINGGSKDTSKDVVFGGGKGEPTLVNGSVWVNVGNSNHTGAAIIYGNVYGGSALGNTSASKTGSDPMVFNASDTTYVNLYAGTINGNVFGGGLGRKYKAAVAADPEHGIEAQSEVTAVESFVGGDVNVLLDGAKVHQVFGCNNLNGTPKGHVKVHVKQTNNFDGNNAYKNISGTALDARTTYDVTAVYGGGNQADYNPTKATGSAADKEKAFAEVKIEGCDKTSIEYVYGGGNAAAVPADSITIESAYIIGYLFGGGNGSGAGNPGANVGIIDTTAYKTNPANGIYGTGIAKTKLIGGQVRYVYGGSNTKGNVRGGTSLERKNTDTNSCDLIIGEIYGAGQVAPMDGDVVIKLDCMPEDFVSQVFGGAKNATINGNVSLTVSSGKFGRVFGGNNEGGSINGTIQVNAYEEGCQPLIIGELYGGGFNAPYSIWGCNDSDGDGTWTPNTPAGDPHVAANADAISVNVYSCTSIGKVFGGGFGATANVVGNTHVWINTMQGIVDGKMKTYGEGVYIGKIGQVFGGGNAAPVKGDVTIDIGTATVSKIPSTGEDAEKIGIRIINGTDYLKTTTDADTTITAGIYGGGNAADVDGNVTMNIGTVSQNQGINIGGNVYGGGYGETTHVTGNVTMNIGADTGTAPAHNYVGYANITGDVYGGSAKGKVNSHLVESTETYTADKTTHVNFYGGTISGNLYGGGLGEATHAADVYGPVTVTMGSGTVNNVFGCNNVLGTPKDSVLVIINGGTVNHSVYGGGNRAAYTPSGEQNYPAVRINHGTVTEDVFGGGLGAAATVTGNPQVTIGDTEENHTVAVGGSVYGGGDEGNVNGNPHVMVQNTHTTIAKNVFGAGKGRDNTFTCAEAMVGVNDEGACADPGSNENKDKGTKVTILNGTIGTLNNDILVAGTGNVYGGGEIGRVEWNTQVEIGVGEGTCAPVIEGCVFGAGQGLETHGYAALVRGNSTVTIGGSAKIGKNVYGGGEIATVGRYWVKNISTTLCPNDPNETEVPTAPGDLPDGMPYKMRRGGICSVTIQGNADIGYHGVASDAGHVFGAGRGVHPNFVESGEGKSQKMTTDGWADFASEAAYLEFLETLALVSRSTVTINGCNIKGNVYGGSESGFVQTWTSVTIKGDSKIGTKGSTTYGNVFGGGKGLATFAEAGKVRGYTAVNISDGIVYGNVYGGGERGYVQQNVSVTVSGGQVVNDVYGGGALANTNTDNWNTSGSAFEYVAVDPVPTVNVTPVGGYYTRSGDSPNYVYTLVPNGKAAVDKTYYKKKVVGDWNATHPYTTKVILTGGVIGNAYGGGLGSSTVAANVYGDVKVTVNKPAEITSTGGSGVAFTRKTVNVTYGIGNKQKEYVIPLTGRVFGCNNINGTPTGDVKVEVYATKQIEIDEQDNYTLYPISGEGSEHSPNSHNKYYEVQAVYGGGNLSDYLPATGKTTSVYIGECDVTSIEKVYGGGNSAVVPSSEVVINGSYDIGTAFGGGNGGDLVQKDGVWYENDGAIVIGTALMKPKGGKVGEVFGGSDAKGFCGNPIIDKTETNPYCKLVTTRMYGAGKESDVDHVDIVISGCTAENTDIEYVFGGSYNAHIADYINLTIKAGVFKNVFGGNDRTGSIGGNITVNIEETEDCAKPLIIQNLFGGGNQAAYPGTKRDGTEIATSGKITVNVKSATRIDNIFGGSFMADVNGDTEVNINMSKGFWAGKTYQGKLIPDSVGVIGNIYGGGNQGVVRGNSKVNICTADSVGYKTIPAHLTYREKDGLYYVPVTGARITGDVFGGGNEANVNGNDTVNICTADYSGISGFQGVSIGKTVYGGGSAADVKGNTFVKMSGGYVFNGVFGGGLSGSVGTFTRRTEDEYTGVYGHTSHTGCIGKPVSCAENTGKCTVVVDGGQIGPVDVAKDGMNRSVANGGPVPQGWVWGGGCGLIEDPSTNPDTHFKTYVGSTDVTIGGTAFILESVIGGGEFGRVLGNTLVKIKDHCQIGVGDGQWETVAGVDKPIRYTDGYDYGSGATTNQFIDPTVTPVTDGNKLAECSHFPYGNAGQHLPYDTYYKKYCNKDASFATNHPELGPASTDNPSDGQTWIGCVFGGGSGYMPYEKADGTGYDWCKSAGWVEGNTEVQITGGHILNNVYGGNEVTDVKGTCTVTMSGGTIGVPRTLAQIAAHPLSCYLFGAGKGDQRTYFNDYNNVGNVIVNVSGGIIYGSVLGGAEDGHVLGNTSVTISGGTIGTWGTSYVDGNVFGGGRGFSGENLAAGTVGGNTTVTINGGKMLGSVYGGGRMASVGVNFASAQDASSGQFTEDTNENTYGHVTINITGGTIGNSTETATEDGHTKGGNVFGGGMGSLTKLDGTTPNTLWTKMAQVKTSSVNITGASTHIKSNVYGGAEYGTTRDRACVTIGGIRNESTGAITPVITAAGTPTINGHVYGGGYGSTNNAATYNSDIVAGETTTYRFTPMQYAGIVGGETVVNIVGNSHVKGNVFGGGEMASVGVIDYSVDGSGNYINVIKHDTYDDAKNTFHDFGLSWPYKFDYVPTLKVGANYIKGGKTTVNIAGSAEVGTYSGSAYTFGGYVFGGGKGKVDFNNGGVNDITTQRYTEAHICNVRETEVTIGGTSTIRTVYGGGDNGHVLEDASITINGGTIRRTAFGGGKGTGEFKTTLLNTSGSGSSEVSVCSWTAGKVYGNTSLTMNNGSVGWFIYGGGNMASVGKGNYTGGSDDYYAAGYGELPSADGAIWTATPAAGTYAHYFQNSGIATVNIYGGTVGADDAGDDSDGIPYGSVFGGSRGKAAKSTGYSPRYKYVPDFFMGYVNKARIKIGKTRDEYVGDYASYTGPTIYGSVYGGGQDGHVRNSTEVTINKGAISGQKPSVDTGGRSGHVFGAGSGIGKYTDGGSYCNSSSGSVTCTTQIDVKGGSIHGNVYGGGALASVGPRNMGKNEQKEKTESSTHASFSHNKVTIEGGSIDGSVFGASRGPGSVMFSGVSPVFSGVGTGTGQYDPTKFATSIWTEVNVKGGTIGGNVYGGGEMGQVKASTVVSLTGGSIAHDAYGGGKGTKDSIAADVGGDVTVELNKSVETTAKGCDVEKIFGCNDIYGTPKGHVTVHVFATQHRDSTQISAKSTKFKSMEGGYTIAESGESSYKAKTSADDLGKLAQTVGLTSDQITAYETAIYGGATDSIKNVRLNEYIEAVADKKYDVLAVYGGGDLAIYEPTDPTENTDVIIEGCDVTSIKQVYGGGNAASTPATNVRINAAYEIHEAFGGGNGKDIYELNGEWYENPGANVGYYATYHHTSAGGTRVSPHPAVENNGSGGYKDATTKDARRVNYPYGNGTTRLEITGGRIHTTYGGSNTRGNIRAEAFTGTEDAGDCPMQIDKSYTAGKSADTDAGSKVEAKCVEVKQDAIYGGSLDANVYSDVVIDITNGTYGKVFGGNDTRGKIYGSITINVHEEGCKPIVIDSLYIGGKLANYSIYGFNDNGTVRTKAQYDDLTPAQKAEITVQRDPQINIISATKIGSIYGGGYQAMVIGNPSINVNMEQGKVLAKYATDPTKAADYTVDTHKSSDGYDYEVVRHVDGDAILALGTIGTIYGGGYKGDVQGNTSVAIGTGEWLNQRGQRETTDADGKVYTYNTTTQKWDWTKTVDETTTSGTVDDKPVPARNAATITGNVFGGGEGEALESGDRAFYCEAAMVGVDREGEDPTKRDGGTTVIIANGTVGTLDGGSLVSGTGNVYGGGKIGRVEKNTVVTIGVEGATGAGTKFRPTVLGSVFGAGQGVATHGYSALVRGNSTVTIQGVAKVGQSVYGGGEKASIGRYTIAQTDEEAAAHGVEKGMPYSLLSDNSGSCTVIVRDSAEIGPNDMIMTRAGGPDNSGHVFGAGQGVYPYEGFSGVNKPWRMTIGGTKEIYNTATAADTLLYLKYVESLGLATQTDVTIGGNAFVKGDVFGGAEQGFVQHDTKVTIKDNCQIGGGYVQMNDAGEYLLSPYSLNRRYTDAEWADGRLYKYGESNYQHSLPECASWRYQSPYAAHDIFAGTVGYDSKGGALTATNGSTFYCNVFGGGSGYFPYAAGKWHWKAGDVGGNTVVEIKGGHILTNVYGGNELTNVEGSCTVTMSGGTIGVPRTLGQITKHPVTCYLFGAGKGDPRVLFNKQTNVQNVKVNVTGGTIYGSVFGGGEDGHVLGNDTVNISGGTIGTWGTSYVDGNVFGGGRGFAGDAYTAGNVAGSVTMNITGGTMLGSVYGGGRLGSVGYGLYDAGATGYGEMRDDNKMDDGTTAPAGMFPNGRGHVEINISGGTIGNTYEYKIPDATNIATLNTALSKSLNTDFTQWSASDWTTWQDYYNVPSTTYDTSDGKLHHTRGGNVYAGGMGRRLNLAGNPISMANEGINWLKLGNVKSTKLTITGGTIKSNVYGGGEYGAVQGNHNVLDGEGNPIKINNKNVVAGTEIIITGGTIGTEILGESASDVTYTYGSVFGGGTGTTDDVEFTYPVAKADTLGAYVADSTRITLTNAKVKASVYGGGELAAVGGNTHVTISGTTEIGRNEVYGMDDENPGYVKYGSWRMGNVYGGGRGSEKAAIAGLVEGNTNVLISGGNVYHNVYGGGAIGSVGTFFVSEGPGPGRRPIPAGVPYWNVDGEGTKGPNGLADGNTGLATVTITGGTIGISGRDNGLVFGSSRGGISDPNEYYTQTEIDNATVGDDAYGKTTNDVKSTGIDQYDRVAWVRGSVVNIGAPNSSGRATVLIKGSVYGGGENGHNYQNAVVNINSGTIGIADKIPGTSDDDPWWNFKKDGVDNDSINEYVRAYRGNVYGAGSGSDYYKDRKGNKHYNPKSGFVGGSTIVNIKGGHIGRAVYGGGAMASVGNVTNDTTITRSNYEARGKTVSDISKNEEKTNSFALSWPYRFEFAPMTGKATVNVTGGHIGTKDVDGGDVFGAARGEAGDRYATAHMAYTNETEVTINYPSTADLPNMAAIQNNYDTPCVTGAVHGSGENGFVYGDTKVTLINGLVGHSIYGGGKGKGTYTKTLNKVVGSGTYPAKIYSLIAGKVFGNTSVTMLGGRVGRNIYGGGNMGSVGKGNFAGGTDDYVNDCELGAAQGYGERINEALWTPSANFNPNAPIKLPTTPGASAPYNIPVTNADYFLSSGKTTVNVISGTVGYIDSDPTVSMKNQLPYGNVIGGSAGEAAPNIAEDPRYEYSPAFFSGYVNETDVTIGGYRCKTAYSTYEVGDLMTAKDFEDVAVADTAKWEVVGPTIYASVYGGGQDGHVRRDTKVTVLGGEIGKPYNATNISLLKTDNLDDPQWLHRGNVYGGGSGITKYKYDFDGDGKTDKNDGSLTYDEKPVNEEDYSNSSGSVTRFTEVNILGGTIHRNVYGGGSMGSVGAPNMGQNYVPYKKDLTNQATLGKQSQNTINIGGGKKVVIIGTPYDSAKGWTYNKLYGGEVYCASRGMSTLNPEEFSYSVWTEVNIFDKATIMGNVYGGGDNGAVKKNAEVNVGGIKH